MADYARERKVALMALRDAAELCRTVQGSIDAAQREKRDKSPVTVADYGSQALICRALRESFPDDAVVAEEGAAELREGGQDLHQRLLEELRAFLPSVTFDRAAEWIDDGSSRTASGRYWTLDPIDGTKGFLRGEQYAISLALIEDGKLLFGALACPNLGMHSEAFGEQGAIFLAERGGGAVVVTEGDEGRPVRVSGISDPTRAATVESVEAAHSDHSWSGQVVKKLGIEREPVRIDSQVKYAMIATGEAEIYLRLPTRPGYREKIWDHAAGVLLVEEAGGRVTDVRGERLDFRQGHRLEKNRGVLVTAGSLHERVVEAVLAAAPEGADLQ